MSVPALNVLTDWTGTDGTLPAGLSDQPIPAHGTIRTASNLGQPQLAGDNQWCSCWWNVESFAADQFAHMQIVTRHTGTAGQFHAVMTRLQAVGTSGVDGYIFGLFMSGGGGYCEGFFYRLTNGSYTQLGATVDMGTGWGNGTEFLGVSEGDTHTLWGKPPSGSWTEIAIRTDSTYSAGGHIGWWASNQTTRVGDMGGGALVTAPGLVRRRRALLGVGR